MICSIRCSRRSAPAAACLGKERDVPLTFYDFPGRALVHPPAANPTDSTFVTVRLRHRRSRGAAAAARA
ncbi:MAG: hypothetical protein J7M21_05195 [Planctomycetes bacterium]|nr:hypothetical protein [Planctomycetota bacterium]